MAPGPFDADLDPATRRDLAARLRLLLEQGPADVRRMATALEVEPEVIVVAMRELRAAGAGRLRSTIHLGHVSWWWEPDRGRKPRDPGLKSGAGPDEPKTEVPSKTEAPRKKGKRKGRRKKS